ncbi:MAG: NAD(P)-dependent oxidoreductase, partial [Rhizobiales bacterium]|nr:NAD(P)-dependent oxidoreductase [Hyphomicrobiales bacterium]
IAVYDIDENARITAQDLGLAVADNMSKLGEGKDVVLVMIATDDQARSVVDELLSTSLNAGAIIVITATIHSAVIGELAVKCRKQGINIVDAPVCYGLQGAKTGELISLCGGETSCITRVTPILMAYSRSVEHIGGHGCGQIAKTCNNMMHWAACVANYETLALARACGIDAQKMRETLLKCPARNTTLERWDTTRFTWHEKDMDVALELAQDANLPLPLFGSIDQLVKRISPDMVKSLLYGESAEYLGAPILSKEIQK